MARNLLKFSPKIAVLVVQKNGLGYYDDSRELNFKFPAGAVVDQEIVDPLQFTATLQQFIHDHHLEPHTLLLVLDKSYCFSKIFTAAPAAEAVNEFLANIPFSSLSSLLAPVDNRTYLLAVNKDLYETIKNVFHQSKFKITLVLPSLALETANLTIKKQLTPHALKEISQKQKILKTFNFLGSRSPSYSFSAAFKRLQNHSSRNLFILLPVFLFLVIILGGLLWLRSHPSVRLVRSGITNIHPIPTKAVTPTIRPYSLESTTIKIITAANRPSKNADKLKDNLASLGFKNVVLSSTTAPNTSAKTILSFSLRYPADLKDKITSSTNKLFIDTIIQDDNNLAADVVITVGQSN
ncbi:hypothetical protein M1116_02320 [Patescibacteria group bacterium]|nr:hypothetical protein [Patescibacteria group bacterium]